MMVTQIAQQQQYKYGYPHTARPFLQPAYVPMQNMSPPATSNIYAPPSHQYDSPPASG